MKVNNSLFLYFALISGVLAACKKTGTESTTVTPVADTAKVVIVKPDTVPAGTYNLALLSSTNVFSGSPTVTDLANQQLLELSGIASSLSYPGRLYTHEDSGNSNEVYMTDLRGADLGKLILDGLSNRDWEDIATGPGPVAGKNYIYVAEIGDNKASSPSVFIYRFAEPDLTAATSSTAVHVTAIDKIELKYPGGAVNAETLLIDPFSKDIYIATKQSGTSTVYLASYPQLLTAATTLKPIARLPFDLLTSGSISADGSELLFRNTGQIWYWKRNAGETIQHMLLRSPQDAPYFRNERQGEAIEFAKDGSGYFTISEIKGYTGAKNQLTFYKRN